MSQKIYIDTLGTLTRVALTDNGELIEFLLNVANDNTHIVGNVYRGRVVNVLQGMQAAFVDIGREKNAFLFVSDMPVDRRDFESEIKLQDCLTVSVGQEIICQVMKDEVGTKGARVTTNLSFVGRNLVATPTLSFFGVSRKIEDPTVRASLRKTLQNVLPEGWGGIARTQSVNASKRELAREAALLKYNYDEMMAAYDRAQTGDVIYRDGGLLSRVARDLISDQVETITVNNAAVADRFRKYLKLVGMAKTEVIDYPPSYDLFGDFDLTRQVNRILSKKVALKNGGSLIIDKTEALTVIDVNSGRFVGSTYLEDTVFAVNMEAAKEIARQVRLRNLGGIIIVDFIDMELEEHRAKVLETLSDALREDRVKTRVAGMSSLGLVELTRKKTGNEIGYYLQDPCPHCSGTGKVIAASVVVPKIAKLVKKAFVDPAVSAVTVTVHSAIADALFNGALSVECETIWRNKRVYVLPNGDMGREDVRIEPHRSAVLQLPDNARLLY